MKKMMAFGFSLLLIFAMVGCSSQPQTVLETETDQSNETEGGRNPATENSMEESSDMRVRLTFDGGEAIFHLEDNAAARDFASRLPMTQTFEDFNEIEKICRLPEEITTDGVEMGTDPEIADVTLYAPWNTLVFYYEDYGYNDQLVPMGHVESGMELLAEMGDEFTVTMELIEDSGQAEPKETTQITMTAGETVITAELDNSETSQEFLATLPCTLQMNRYDDREYYGRIDPLSENGTAIESFQNGDLTYYPAGPSLAVFFDKEDTSRQGGLIRMGKITSDLSAFATMGETEEVLIEIAE